MARRTSRSVAFIANLAFMLAAVLPQFECGYAAESGLGQTLEGVTKVVGNVGDVDIPSIDGISDLQNVELLKKLQPILSALSERNPAVEALAGGGSLQIPGLENMSDLVSGKFDLSSEDAQKVLQDLGSQRVWMEELMRLQFTELAKDSLKKAMVTEAGSNGTKTEEGILDVLQIPALGNSSLPNLDLLNSSLGDEGGFIGDAAGLSLGGDLPLAGGIEAVGGGLGKAFGDFSRLREAGKGTAVGKNLRTRYDGVREAAAKIGSGKGVFLEGLGIDDETDDDETDDETDDDADNEENTETDDTTINTRAGLPFIFNPSEAAKLLSLDPTSATAVKTLGDITAAGQNFFPTNQAGFGQFYKSLSPLSAAGTNFFDGSNFGGQGVKQLGALSSAGATLMAPALSSAGATLMAPALSSAGAQLLAPAFSPIGAQLMAPAAVTDGSSTPLPTPLSVLPGAGGKGGEMAQAMQLIAELQKERANWKTGTQFAEGLNKVTETINGISLG